MQMPSVVLFTPNMNIQIQQQTISLLPDRALFWVEEQVLVLGDLHIGKVTHFRKNGIQVPSTVAHEELSRFAELVVRLQPQLIVIVGDLFHHQLNSEWDLWSQMLQSIPSVPIRLVRGNHDILPAYIFKEQRIQLSTAYIHGPFVFSHEPIANSNFYNITAHVHPAVMLGGKAQQRLRIPCFYFAPTYAILPAFGIFTGTHIIEPSKADQVFGIANQSIIQLT
jgi:uncharacterized protein